MRWFVGITDQICKRTMQEKTYLPKLINDCLIVIIICNTYYIIILYYRPL